MKLRICLTFLTSFALFSITSFGQGKPQGILRAGINLANVSTKANGRFDDANTYTSYQVGLLGDFHVASMAYLQPGIVFTGKGTKAVSGDPSSLTYYKATVNPYYIEIPLTLLLKSPGKTKLIAGAGPYVAFGVGGKNKVKGQTAGVVYQSEQNIEFSDDNSNDPGMRFMKRVDYGFNGTVGVETSHIILSGHFGYGLAKLQAGTTNNTDDYNKNRVISFTLGFKL
jgi:hypothetical protein